ncbi:hypothetical protein NC661_06080 [Aquibacillus koreensis]|uniref:Uncharacterized protein n=1 Tax=Aquibacillus koreensis TaxID=279446 RepID=A0A9X4AHG1_9BACI|nr:CBO0543 family protein [Aquibacillus koreensis]MCT2537081.1 hypothetical protein [Aquibacillus koreensis]MDC3419936.1 hypothetical protein [Aquibacillus koreensis]
MSFLHFLNVLQIHAKWEEIIQMRRQIRDMMLDYWLTSVVFTFNWWLLLITTISLFIIWMIVLDKKRIIEISAFGLLVGTTGFILDIVGITLVFWSYPNRLIPVMPPIVEIHHVHLPIFFMLIYQFCNSWKSFLIAMITTSFIFSFIFEPLTEYLGIYEVYSWKHIYSFPIYVLIGLLFRWLLIKVKRVEQGSTIK